MMRAQIQRLTLLGFFSIVTLGCENAAGTNDGVTMRCKEMATRQPEIGLDPKTGCRCVATKLQDLLTDDDYSLLERYSATLTQIALDNPELRGRESHDRTLAALADERGDSATSISEALGAGLFHQLRVAENLCSAKQ